MAKGFGVSPISKKIYYGTQNKEKRMWTGNKEDVTDEAIATVFEWFVMNFEAELRKNPEAKGYNVTYGDSDYELILKRKEAKNEEKIDVAKNVNTVSTTEAHTIQKRKKDVADFCEWYEPNEELLNDDAEWTNDGAKDYLICFKDTDNDKSSYDVVRNRRYYTIATWYSTNNVIAVKGWYFGDKPKPNNYEVVAYADIPDFKGEYA